MAYLKCLHIPKEICKLIHKDLLVDGTGIASLCDVLGTGDICMLEKCISVSSWTGTLVCECSSSASITIDD